MLTIEKLKAMKPQTIFAHGTIPDREWVGGRRWVAQRGGIHDWAIYQHFGIHSIDYVAKYGDKIHNPSTITTLVPCDDEALKMYRQ